MPKTMLSKFPGTCRECSAAIPRGAAIVYHGRHQGVSCARCAGITPEGVPTCEPAFVAGDRAAARGGLTVVRTSSGWSGTRNSRGRCEDAPAAAAAPSEPCAWPPSPVKIHHQP